LTKRYLVFDDSVRADLKLEIRTRVVAGAVIARIYPEGGSEGDSLKAGDGWAREWTGPSEDYAVMEADRWLRNQYEVRMQDTLT